MAAINDRGEEYIELVVSVQPKDNKIATNEHSPDHFRMPNLHVPTRLILKLQIYLHRIVYFVRLITKMDCFLNKNNRIVFVMKTQCV
jgi:hypothetical protein